MSAEYGTRWPALPKLSDDDRAEIHRLMYKFADQTAARRAEYAARLESTARWLGREVGGHRMTLKDAAARLEALAFREDSDCAVPASMLPLDVAIEITSEAFAAGMNGATP